MNLLLGEPPIRIPLYLEVGITAARKEADAKKAKKAKKAAPSMAKDKDRCGFMGPMLFFMVLNIGMGADPHQGKLFQMSAWGGDLPQD